jgi:hypothetical protein
MISVRNCIVCLIGLGTMIILGCGGGSDPGPGPEQTVRKLFETEWSDSIEAAWDMFHPVWQENGYDGNFARYANIMKEKNNAWAEHPRTITRSKTFSGKQIPIPAQKFVETLGRDKYDFAVVRIDVDYPQVPGYRGGVVDYFITLARKKEKGSQWQIISRIDDIDSIGETKFFNW